jgi:hypothetical protein
MASGRGAVPPPSLPPSLAPFIWSAGGEGPPGGRPVGVRAGAGHPAPLLLAAKGSPRPLCTTGVRRATDADMASKIDRWRLLLWLITVAVMEIPQVRRLHSPRSQTSGVRCLWNIFCFPPVTGNSIDRCMLWYEYACGGRDGFGSDAHGYEFPNSDTNANIIKCKYKTNILNSDSQSNTYSIYSIEL